MSSRWEELGATPDIIAQAEQFEHIYRKRLQDVIDAGIRDEQKFGRTPVSLTFKALIDMINADDSNSELYNVIYLFATAIDQLVKIQRVGEEILKDPDMAPHALEIMKHGQDNSLKDLDFPTPEINDES